MARIHRTLPAKGTRIGIAFSGGLDTRTAVAWMSRAAASRSTRTPPTSRSPTRRTSPTSRPSRCRTERRVARLVDCREAMVREGIIAVQCGAFHLTTGGKRYFNTTPLGRAVTTTAIIRAMREDGVDIFSDGSTHKGNDIQRFFRYGVLVNPDLGIYKPWLDRAFVEAFGGRKEMSEYLVSVGLPYTMATEKAYSTDANVLGATHEAKDLERLDASMRIVEPIMGVAHWKERRGGRAGGGHGRAFARRAGVDQRRASREAVRPVPRDERHRRPARPGDERPDREPRHRRQEPRHLRGAGHGAAAHRLRAPAVGRAQREHDRPVLLARPQAGAAALRGALVRSRGAGAQGGAHALGRDAA